MSARASEATDLSGTGAKGGQGFFTDAGSSGMSGG